MLCVRLIIKLCKNVIRVVLIARPMGYLEHEMEGACRLEAVYRTVKKVTWMRVAEQHCIGTHRSVG